LRKNFTFHRKKWLNVRISFDSLKRFENTEKISLEALLKLAHLSGRLKDFYTIFQPGDDLIEVEKLFIHH
jgi:uncharacterized membrane protein YukC